jgi:5-methylcytosine-specific restriction enzyme A
MPTHPRSFQPLSVRTVAAARATRTERGYSNRWARAAKVFLIEHPLCACEACQARAVPLPATVVDHRIPHRGDPILFWDPSNWQALAKRCHDRKTLLEQRTAPAKVTVRRLRRGR